ncbi:MAG TPA: 2OG-Fe(II) oxygenase [Sphingomicrobium sp.]
MSIAKRISQLDWEQLTDTLHQQGWATTGQLLTDAERSELAASYDQDCSFRSTVVMARHGFGRGEYRYFAYPLPALVQEIRQKLYERLVPLANRWREALGMADPFPAKFEQYILRCHAAGQTRPTPLILRYGPGDFNCLHQDLYGELNFPLQAAFLLSRPGEDFTGGEFVLTEQRPRMQSRVQVVSLQAGEAVIFAVNHRPVQGTRGTYRVTMRHGVSPLREGRRHMLGIVLHDAS